MKEMIDELAEEYLKAALGEEINAVKENEELFTYLFFLARNHVARLLEEKEGEKIMIVGVGGSGCDFVNRLASLQLPSRIFTVAIDSEKEKIERVKASAKFFVPEKITKEPLFEEIERIIKEAKAVFVVFSPAGETGSKLAMEIASIADKEGKPLYLFAILPVSMERERRKKAIEFLTSIKLLSINVSDLVIFDNEVLLGPYKKFSLKHYYTVVDSHISAVITKKLEELE